MIAEIITIGDELIGGHRVDTNSAFISRLLTGIGLEVRYITSVGDSLETMEEVISQAMGRAQVVITTGGLGPTDDDITKRAICKVFKRNLVFHEEILDDLRQRFAERGVELPAINQNQALLPQGAHLFANQHGSAVGICLTVEARVFIALPGVPFEMEQIMRDEIIPYLSRLKIGFAVKVASLKTIGIIESKLAEMIAPEFTPPSGMKLAYLPAPSGVELRLTATAETEEEATSAVRAAASQLETVVGRYVFGRDNDTLEEVIGQLLVDNDKSLAVAESCTGGQLGMIVTSVAGSSRYFLGGVVTYSNEAKIELLGVDPDIIDQHGAVSAECAKAMAEGCRQRFNSDFALSITGIAGPDGGTDEKPVGTTFLGLSSRHETYAKHFNLGSLRATIRTRAVYAALELLRRDILDIK